MKKYLIVTAHPDDAEITMGGTIKKLTSEGHKVMTIIASIPTNNVEVRKSEAIRSADYLDMEVKFLDTSYPCTVEDYTMIGLITQLDKIIEDFQPDAIFTHSIDDSHQDHRIISQAVQACFRKYMCDVYNFEQTNQSNLINSNRFIPDLYIDISEHFESKLNALRMHASQLAGYMVHYVSDIKKLAEWRGYQYGTKYAETFKTVFKKELL
ncbi:PIG-L deacetylase family protein [Paenibacillus woosongensis]|uniref:PIG-L deacetylase family protein n=1 Tax=Paenibacillus woosongensis TaxID=307580 RepID=A0AA95ICT0_9BACL|nr:PIG-L deacetylase family protein [Paenibacillus woosongensis]WHX50777.1 PIG-L deacetylase family protein [Paenibacillus woosongensis]